ncbi:hypothetical protein IWT140_01333 [Secundilactobacillus pentosiphilus]|uniref:Uncharacterized protein n=1 Tax=Secundilactobacillus pentosiphilus TaxID=1714682 RepID=A0A1Z5IQ07_9LACO|nr:hypothetical protein [Secundilactobacillus pentosiphilus]GAX03708.1 hypothetical protein IWT140_01333 [Secundilactobacillus pentosiphilus]
MTVQLKAAKLAPQMYAKPESHPQSHYKYVIGATTKVKHPLVEPQAQQEERRRTRRKQKRSWFTTFGTAILMINVIKWVWPYVKWWVIDIGLILFMILGLVLMLEFFVWLDNKTGGGGGYSGDSYDDSYDAGWFDSWAYHNDDNGHNDNLY